MAVGTTLYSAASMLNLNSIGNYTFKPKQPVDIHNPIPLEISANCKLTTQDASDTLSGKMLKGSGTLNGHEVGTGLSIQVKNGDVLKISATALATVEISNEGQHDVIAQCGLGKRILK